MTKTYNRQILFILLSCFAGNAYSISYLTKFQKVHFIYGDVIETHIGVWNTVQCLKTCLVNCGYARLTDAGVCVLYYHVVLLTEPAVTDGQVVGYRKVICFKLYCTLKILAFMYVKYISSLDDPK